MNKTLQYRGFSATIEYSTEDRCYVGKVLDITDTVAFDGLDIDEVEASFHKCIDDYILLLHSIC